MKAQNSSILCLLLALSGCATTSTDAEYYDAVKAISKDQTMAQVACWAAVSELAKNGDESSKANAIRLGYYTCKVEKIKLENPKRSGF